MGSAGRSTTDDLKMELGLEARGYQQVRRSLESRGAILSRSISVEVESGGHRHLSEFMRWDQMVNPGFRGPGGGSPPVGGAVVRAAVLISEGGALTLRWSLRSEMRLLFELAGLKVVADYGDFRGGPPAYGREQVWVLANAEG